MYFVDSGRPLTGAPPLLKTRSHMRLNDARKLWRELQGQGWKQVDPQWGADVDVYVRRVKQANCKPTRIRANEVKPRPTHPLMPPRPQGDDVMVFGRVVSSAWQD